MEDCENGRHDLEIMGDDYDKLPIFKCKKCLRYFVLDEDSNFLRCRFVKSD